MIVDLPKDFLNEQCTEFPEFRKGTAAGMSLDALVRVFQVVFEINWGFYVEEIESIFQR